MALISVIIPVYNVERYIKRCACSLFEQTFKDIEFIFVDDCSTDDSVCELKKVIDPYPKCQVKLITHNKNQGASASRNDGLTMAIGKYIGFVDADDWVEPDMYQKLYEEMTLTNSDIVWCDYYKEYENNTEVIYTAIPMENKSIFMNHYLMQPLTPLWIMLVKADGIQRNGIYFLNGFDWCEDLNVSAKLSYYSNKVSHLAIPLYHYRDNPISICHTTSKKKYEARLKNVIDLYNFFLGKDIYDAVKKSLFYRILLSKQFYLYDEKKVTDYISLCPEANSYILSNPMYGVKSKLVEWLTVKLYTMIVTISNIKI